MQAMLNSFSRLTPRGRMAVRLSFFYAGLFAVNGIYTPFWSVWLKAQGMTAEQIGLLLAVCVWARIIANPIAGHIADIYGGRRQLIICLFAVSLIAALSFGLVDGFWWFLGITLVLGLFWGPAAPLGDSLAILVCLEHKLDFGWIRSWGSMAFVGVVAFVGWLLKDRSDSWIYILFCCGLTFSLISGFALPHSAMARPKHKQRAPIVRLLGNPMFLLLLVAGGLGQASHAMYYVFGSLHWSGAGLGDGTIGLLWAEGVIAEIGVFAISGLLLRRLEPGTLLLLGGLGGILRWTVTAFTADVSILAVLQPLHGLTFCANFLGATYFIGRNVRVDVSASAQSLNAVASSAAMGLGMFFAGPLYSLLGGEAFLVMSLLSACSALGAWQLQRRWRGGEIG